MVARLQTVLTECVRLCREGVIFSPELSNFPVNTKLSQERSILSTHSLGSLPSSSERVLPAEDCSTRELTHEALDSEQVSELTALLPKVPFTKSPTHHWFMPKTTPKAISGALEQTL